MSQGVRVKTTLIFSWNISCSFARNEQLFLFFFLNHATAYQRRWTSKAQGGLFLIFVELGSQGQAGVAGRLMGAQPGGGVVNHLVWDHISSCWSCHFMLWWKIPEFKSGGRGTHILCTLLRGYYLQKCGKVKKPFPSKTQVALLRSRIFPEQWALAESQVHSGDTKVVTLILVLLYRNTAFGNPFARKYPSVTKIL